MYEKDCFERLILWWHQLAFIVRLHYTVKYELNKNIALRFGEKKMRFVLIRNFEICPCALWTPTQIRIIK
jgi:hypothetical protein